MTYCVGVLLDDVFAQARNAARGGLFTRGGART